MAYIVKYIDSCARNNIDIYTLCQRDLKLGNRVVLVCSEKYATMYTGDSVVPVNSAKAVKNCTAPLMLLTAEKSAGLAAVELSAALYAVECQLYIGYNGIFTSDPKVTDYANRLDRIDYDEVVELCHSGYTGVDMQVVEAAKKAGVILHVLPYNNPDGEGTIIKEVMAFGSATVKGIMKEPDICIVSLRDIPDVSGISYHIFQAVSDAGINVDMISLPASDYGRQDISFTIHKEDKDAAEKILKEKQAKLGYSDVIIKDDVAKISVVGSGVKTSKGVAARVFGILYKNGISLRLISTSEIKISVFVDKESADLAVQKIHNDFIN